MPRTGGALLAFNHICYVDFVYGGLAAQPSRRLVRFMAKRELFDHRWTGPLMRSLHHIEVDRADGVASFDDGGGATSAAGEVVGIFPEATISRAMELKEFKTGAVRIAAAAGVPLVPVILWGTQRLMTKDHPRDFSRGTPISIPVGEPLHPTGADPVAETAELRGGDGRAARRGDRGVRRRAAASGRVVGPGLLRRQRTDPGGGGGAGRRGEARPGRRPRRQARRQGLSRSDGPVDDLGPQPFDPP